MTLKFVVKERDLVKWPVIVMEADETKPGTRVAHGFVMEFDLLDRHAARAENDRIQALPIQEQSEAYWNHILSRCTGWSGVEDKAGAPMPFSVDALKRVCGQLIVMTAVAKAYSEAISGDEARIKN